MSKITVRDTFKDFHTFTGNVYAVEQDGGCKVFERLPDGKSRLLQSFGPHIFGWLKTEQDRATDIPDGPAAPLDRFTQAGIQNLSGDRPSLRLPLNGTEISQAIEESEMTGNSVEETLNTAGLTLEIGDNPEFINTGNSYEYKRPEENAGLANVPGGVLSLEAGTVPGNPPPSAQKKPRVRPSRAKPKPDAAQATMAAAVAEGLIPGAPAEEEGPPPKLDDLLASGLLKKGVAVPVDSVSHEAGIAGDLADAVADPEIREVDVDAELDKAEQKHAARVNCEVCKGRGTVPDPESQDPLDTIICPAC